MNKRLFAIVVILLLLPIKLRSQTTDRATETSNNTSGCPSSGSLPPGCTGFFNGLTDHRSQSEPGYPYTPPGPPITPAAVSTQTLITVPPAGNVSKISLKTLLYPGYMDTITTQIVCHYQPWFGGNSHISIGMNENDANTVDRQAQDMIDRGCDVVTLNWYGNGGGGDGGLPNLVSQLWRDNLDNRCALGSGVCPLELVIMEDAGTISGATLTGVETDLRYIYDNFMNGHASYLRVSDQAVPPCVDRPVVIFFGWPVSFNWSAVKTWIHSTGGDPPGLGLTCNGEPVLGTEGENGFSNVNLDGAYNWIGVDAYDDSNSGAVYTPGLSGTVQFNPHELSGSGSFAVDSWYTAASQNLEEPIIIGSAYVGFNDTNANWGFSVSDGHPNGRKMARQCGQVWLNSWNRLTASGYFSGTSQIPFVGVPTWNDYEEGSAIEPGIDNCIDLTTFQLAVASNTLCWNFSSSSSFGTPATIDHYILFDSTDGGATWTFKDSNIPTSACTFTPPTVSCSISLPSYQWDPGTHTLNVKAVGKPSIMNVVSPNGVDYTP